MTIEAMKQALEALEEINKLSIGEGAICLPAEIDTAMDALRQAIAEAERQDHIEQHLEMVEQGLQVWVISNSKGAGQFSWEPQDEKFWTRMVPVNTHPPKREPLTDEQIATISVECATVSPSDIYFARAIEAAHGIKGEA